MRERLPAIGLAVVCVFGATARAEAQLTTSCLRPFAIVDKWIENQTPPFDGFDTFDPSGPNPDVYLPEYGGFKPLEDDGRLIVLTGQAGAGQTISAGAYVPLRLDESNGGATAYRNNILGCVGLPHSMGELLPIEGGILTGVTVHAVSGLIAMDPAARWDGDAKQIVGSAFGQSPRVIHLPVIDPAEYEQAQQTGVSAIHIKNIVGFFVDSMQSDGAIRGYLTARATLSTLPSIVPPGRMFAMVGAQLETPGGILSGVPIELEFLGETAGVALTDEWNEPVHTSVAIGTLAPGRYVAAIRARLATGYFLRADESTADFIVQQVPQITWPAPSPIAYGTPLGPSQLNAAAPIPGQFTYWPPSGTILHAGQRTLSVTFMPLDREQYVDVVITAVGINVLPAPLTVSIIPASKLYLDPMPAFPLVGEGFVNGDTLASLSGAAVFQTSATASSPVGAYAVNASGLSSPNYAIQYQPGTLNVLSRVATLLYVESVPGHRFNVLCPARICGGLASPTTRLRPQPAT
jgi:hypothetical protein